MKTWVKNKLRKTLENLQEEEISQNNLRLEEVSFQEPPEPKAPQNKKTSSAKAPNRSKLQSIVVFNDVHIPFHHEKACQNLLKFCKDFQPDNIVINGDFLDCYSVSIFPKAPGGPNLQEELDLGAIFLSTLRRNCPDSEIDYLEGNHEERLKRLVKQQHSLYGLRAFSLPNLLGLDTLGIRYHAYKHPVDFGNGLLTFTHGHRVSKHSAYSAKAHLLDDGYQNVIIGHTHRLGSYYHTGHIGKRRAFENGGLFDKSKLEYVVEPNWQNGFCVVYLRKDKPDFLQIIPVEVCDTDGSFIWAGQIYGG